MSEAVRVRAYDWLREQADATVAEYVMSRLSPVPAAELATKDDVRAVKEDVRLVKEDVRLVKDDVRAVKADIGRVEGKVDALAGRVDEKFDRLVELREADLKERAAEREADLQQRTAEREADLQRRTAEREADRKDAGRRAWTMALALPVEVCGAVRRRRSDPGVAARLSSRVTTRRRCAANCAHTWRPRPSMSDPRPRRWDHYVRVWPGAAGVFGWLRRGWRCAFSFLTRWWGGVGWCRSEVRVAGVRVHRWDSSRGKLRAGSRTGRRCHKSRRRGV